MNNNIKTKDIKDVDLGKVYLHYTNIDNLEDISKKGLEPRIGINAKLVEKTKKVFFSKGDVGALVIMDVWLKWLIAKPISNYIYWFGAWLLKFRYFPKIFHKVIISSNQKSEKKKHWAFKRLNFILNNSVYLVLDLIENKDFSFDDIDEAKQLFKNSANFVDNIYAHNSVFTDPKIEYWNMHTFSNKIIEKQKISLLKLNDSYNANDIIKYLASKNEKYVEKNCLLLKEYLNYVNEKENLT